MLKRFLVYALVFLLSGLPAYAQRPIGGGSSGGGTSFNGVLLDAAAGDPVTDTTNNAIRVNIVAGAVGGSGGTSSAEDAAAANADLGTPAYSVRNDSVTGATSADGDYQPLKSDSAGRLYVTGTGGTFPVTDNSGSLTVDAPVATPVFVRLSDGTNPISTLEVSLASVPSHAVTNAGTFVVQENGAALTALQLIDNVVGVEDAVAGSAYSGVPLLAVRQDSQTALAADGDFISPTIDSAGGLRVSIVAGAGSGGTAMTDDAAFTAGTTSITPVGAMFDDTSTDSVNENDAGIVRMSANRNMYTTLRDAAGNERGANVNASNELLTSSNTELPSAAAMADDTANPTVPGVAAYMMAFDGTTWDRARLATDQTEDAAAAGGEGGPMVLTVRRDTAASSAGTDGDFATLNTDASGRLWVNCGTGCSGGTQYAEDAAHASGNTGTLALVVRNDAGTALAADGDNIPLMVNSAGALYTAVTGTVTVASHAVTNAGTFVTQENGAALTALQLIDDVVFTDDAAYTPGTSSLAMSGYQVDESSTDSVDEGDAGAARMTLDRLAYAAVGATASRAQSLNECTIVSAASTNSTNCKNAAGNFYGIDLINTTTTVYYLRMYNTSSAPTCSSATGFIRSIPIPPAAAAGGAGGVVRVLPVGVGYDTGISFCLTGGSSSTDNTSAATGIFGTILYK